MGLCLRVPGRHRCVQGCLHPSGQRGQGFVRLRGGIVLKHQELGIKPAQIPALGGQSLHAGIQCRHHGADALIQLIYRAFQGIHPVEHGIDSPVNVIAGAADFLVLIQVFLVQLVQQSGRNDSRREIQGKIPHVRGNFEVLRNVHILGIAQGFEIQHFSEAWQYHAQSHAAVVQAEDFSVGHLHIGKYILIQGHQGHGHQGHRHRVGLLVYLHGTSQPVFVVKAHGKVAGLPRQCLRRNLRPVQGISNGDLHGQRLGRGGALIVDVLPLVVPGQGAVWELGIFLVALGVADVRQSGFVPDGSRAIPAEDYLHLHLLGLARGSRRHMDALLLVPVLLGNGLRSGRKGQASDYQCPGKECRHHSHSTHFSASDSGIFPIRRSSITATTA